MRTRSSVAAALLVIAAGGAVEAQERPYGLGSTPTPAEIRELDISISPDGKGLPAGSGTAVQGALVYAQLSAHEGFGIALAESMLAGATPVVAPSGAIPEVVGTTGEYAAYGDVDATIAAIRRALEHPRGELARARIAETFTLEQRRRGIARRGRDFEIGHDKAVVVAHGFGSPVAVAWAVSARPRMRPRNRSPQASGSTGSIPAIRCRDARRRRPR